MVFEGNELWHQEWRGFSLERYLPDYCSDLNAIRDPRSGLSQEQRVKFLNTLRSIINKRTGKPVSDFDLMDATAGEQAEAIVRAIGKWEDQQC